MNNLGICEHLINNCQALKIYKPFEIQKIVIPKILNNENVLITAPTGQGKTAAYCLPLLQKYIENPHPFFALILVPSRELALQTNQQFNNFGNKCGLKTITICGGFEATKQIELLETFPSIVIGTPGRLSIVLENDIYLRKFKKLKSIVLDECDKLFYSPMNLDTEKILSKFKFNYQLLCFSATLSDYKTEIIKQFNNRPYFEKNYEQRLADIIHNKIYIESAVLMYHILLYLIHGKVKEITSTSSGIIFTKSIKDTEIINELLNTFNINSVSLQSLQSQKERNNNIFRFINEGAQILVCTDIGSRGLDIPTVDWVINFGLPRTVDDYIHRVGRCGRSYRSGFAITLILERPNNVAERDRNNKLLNDYKDKQGITLKNYNIDLSDALSKPHTVNDALAKARSKLEHSDFMELYTMKLKRRKQEINN